MSDFLEEIRDEEIERAWKENEMIDVIREKLHEVVERTDAEQAIKDCRWLLDQLKHGSLRW